MEESLGWLHPSVGIKMIRDQAWEGQGVCCSHFSVIKKQAEG